MFHNYELSVSGRDFCEGVLLYYLELIYLASVSYMCRVRSARKGGGGKKKNNPAAFIFFTLLYKNQNFPEKVNKIFRQVGVPLHPPCAQVCSFVFVAGKLAQNCFKRVKNPLLNKLTWTKNERVWDAETNLRNGLAAIWEITERWKSYNKTDNKS